MIYFFFPIFFSFCYLIRDKRIKLISVYLFILSMTCFAGLRWQTGTDWIPYYENFLDPYNRIDFEIGYHWYVLLIRNFTDDYTFFLFLTSFIPLLFIFAGCKKVLGDQNSGQLILSLLIFYSYYFLGSFFGAERRIVAIGLSFYALAQYVLLNRWSSFLCILLASLFHLSSLFTLVIFVSRYFSVRRLSIILFVSILVLLPLSSYISSIIVWLVDFIPIEIFKIKILEYTINADEYGGFNYTGAIKRIFIAFILIYGYYFSSLKKDCLYNNLLKIYLMGVFSYMLFSPISSMFGVLTIYLSVSEILLLPMVIQRNRIFFKQPYLYLFFIIYLVYQTYSILNSYPDLFYPYINVIFGGSRLGLH